MFGTRKKLRIAMKNQKKIYKNILEFWLKHKMN